MADLLVGVISVVISFAEDHASRTNVLNYSSVNSDKFRTLIVIAFDNYDYVNSVYKTY